MIWNNFTVFKTNYSFTSGTLAYMLQGFLRMSRGASRGINGIRNSRNLISLCPQINAFMSVGTLLKYFRRKLLQFARSKTVSNLGMSHFQPRSQDLYPSLGVGRKNVLGTRLSHFNCTFISLSKLCSAASITRALHLSTLNFTY